MHFFENPMQRFQRKVAARQAFMQWLANEHPQIASRAASDSGMGMLGEFLPSYLTPPKSTDTRTEYVTKAGAVVKSSTPSPATVTQQDNWWQGAVRNISDAIPQLATSYYQTKAISANMRRAEQGLPPVDYSASGPTVNVKAQADPAIMRTVLLAAGVIGAALVLPKLIGR